MNGGEEMGSETGAVPPEQMLDVAVISSSPVVRAGLSSMLTGAVSAVYTRVYELDPSGRDSWQTIPETAAEEFDVAIVSLSPSENFTAQTIPDSVSARSVVILTDRTDSVSSAPEVLEGVTGWAVVPADAGAAEISAAVFAASQGLVAVSQELLSPETNLLPTSNAPENRPASSSLTERELEVLNLISTGLPNKSIARSLGISEHTVKFHISSIFTRLDVVNRAEAVSVGVRLGLLVL